MKRIILPFLMAISYTTAIAQTADTDLKYYNMSFDIDPDVMALSAENRIHFAVSDNNDKPIELELSNMHSVSEVISLSADTKLRFEHSNNKITVFPNGQWGAMDSISIKYASNESFGKCDGIQFTRHRNVSSIWTLSCPYAGSDWFVCKQENADKIDSVTITTTSPEKYRTASNGVLISDITDNGKRTMTWHHRYPIDYYLICMACTNYEVFSDFVDLDDGSKVEIVNMVYPEYLDRAKMLSKKLIPVFQLYCKLFGKYPFSQEKYGQAQFGWGGGMEHQTMTFVADFEIKLTAHELSHQWFGDNITCNTWNEVWLNESFATYCEYIVAEAGLLKGTTTEWLNMANHYATNEKSGKIYVDDAYDFAGIFNYSTSYCKGALMLHQLRLYIGDEAFFKAMKSYATDPDLQYKTAKAEHFIKHVNNASGKDMSWLFDQWLNKKGFPIFTVDWNSKGNFLKLRINQMASNHSDQFFRMMLPIQIKGPNGESETIMFDISSPKQEQKIKLNFAPASITVDPRHETITKEAVVTRNERL